MKSKKEYVILAAVIIVMALYLVLHKTDRTYFELPKLPEIKKTDITEIKITKADKTIDLQKKDDKWYILPENYLADTTKIDPMLDAISGLTLTALAAESENYNRFELDDAHKVTIFAMAGDKQLRSFDMGKAAESNQLTFVKLPDDKRVYHARDNFKTKFDVAVDALRDLTVLAFDKSQIQQIEISGKDKPPMVFSMKQEPVQVSAAPEGQAAKPEEGQTVEKETKPEGETPEKNAPPKPVWMNAEGKTMADADVNSLLESLSKLKCKNFINGKTKEDFSSPICTLKLQGAKSYELLIFEKTKEDNTYPAVSSESEYPFALPQYKVEDLMNKFK